MTHPHTTLRVIVLYVCAHVSVIGPKILPYAGKTPGGKKWGM